jgi:ferredoxin-like protein FixX
MEIMPEHTIHFDNKSERNKFLKQCLRNKIVCPLCENKAFNVENNSLEQIVLTCINCGWIHVIANEDAIKNKTYLKLSYDDEK